MTSTSADALSGVLLTVEFILALLLALYLYYKYSDIRKINPIVTISTLVVWFLSFVIIFLLPVDVSSAFYRLCLDNGINSATLNHSTDIGEEPCSKLYCTGVYVFNKSSNYTLLCNMRDRECYQPYSFICKLPLEVMWYLIYWLFFFLSWVILPLIQSYVLAGYFTVWKKVLRALIENAIFYISLLVIVIILFVYVVLVKKLIALTELPYIIATASNTWGLIILAFLLGYGLVEVPRSLINASRHTYTLNHCYFRAAKLYVDLAEANETLQEVTQRVKVLSQQIHYNDPLRKYLELIIKKFPNDIRTQFSKGHDDYEDYKPSEDALSKSSLEKLYKKVAKTVRLTNTSKIQWTSLTEQILDLEDIDTNKSTGNRVYKSSVREKRKLFDHVIFQTIELYWKVYIRRWVYRVLACLLGFLSLCIVWSEVVFSLPRFSIFGFLVYTGHQLGHYGAIEFISVLVVAYLSFCAYYTVFKIRIFNLYFLAPHHSTDEYSLLFSAVLLSRLALPICLNYLYIIQVVRLEHHEDDDAIPLTAFAYATGNTELIPWLSSYAYWLYPVLILLICIATVFSLGSRISSLLGYQKFMGEDDFSADYIDEGKALIKRERRLREKSLRECGRVLRNQLHTERLSEITQERETRGSSLASSRRDNRRHDDDDNDDSTQLDRLWGKAKGFASRKKSFMPNAKYSTHSDTLLIEDQDEPEEESGRSNHTHHSSSFNNNFRNSSFNSRGGGGIFDDV